MLSAAIRTSFREVNANASALRAPWRLEPEVLIADEAVSALDVSIQAQILALVQEIQKRLQLTIVFITHDLRVAARVCDRVIVMQYGETDPRGFARRSLSGTKSSFFRISVLSLAPNQTRRLKGLVLKRARVQIVGPQPTLSAAVAGGGATVLPAVFPGANSFRN